MNKYLVGAVAIVAFAGSSAALADGIGTISQSIYSVGSGGEFTISPTSGYLGEVGLFADLTANTFQTFCMETDELFSPGGSYTMIINTVSIAGGNGGPSTALTPETAYLYWHFRNGTLAGFDYGANRLADTAQLQAAIWFLQGDQQNTGPNGLANFAIAQVLGGFGLGGVGNIGDVRVLNVYDTNGGLHQDQLTIIPTPGSAALLGAGILLSGRRRRA